MERINMNMNITIERRKTDCTALPKGWQREEVLRKSGLSAGKVDVFYYSPTGKKIENKPQLARQLGDVLDVSTFDFQSGKLLPNTQLISIQRTASSLKRKLPPGTTAICSPSSSNMSSAFRHHLELSRGIRNDISLVPPIRQTASIFKQPVTVVKNQEGKVRHDLKHGTQEKPKQLFWEKRLEGLRACDITGSEYESIELPKGILPVGPNVTEQTLLQSVATALHVSNQPVTGQMASKTVLTTNSGAFLNPDQPLMHAITITEDDIRRQEERVTLARRRLQDALKG